MFKFSLQIKGNVTRNLNIITHGSLSEHIIKYREEYFEKLRFDRIS